MTIGLICAIPQELAHLRAALEGRDAWSSLHARFDRGRLDGHEVVLVGAGIGKVNTALVATAAGRPVRLPADRVLRRGGWARPVAAYR